LFICNKVPNNIEIKIKGYTITFNWYIIKKVGANFCHVINKVAINIFRFFVIFTNHSWNGEAAILINSAKFDIIIIINIIILFVLINIMENNKNADVIDWIIKYFMLISEFFVLFIFNIIKEQNDMVLSSNIIQIITQDLLNIQETTDI